MRAARAGLAPPLEVALVGVPLDLGATYRIGRPPRSGRRPPASRLIARSNPATGVAPFRPLQRGRCRRRPSDPLDVIHSVALIQGFFEQIQALGGAGRDRRRSHGAAAVLRDREQRRSG